MIGKHTYMVRKNLSRIIGLARKDLDGKYIPIELL